MATETNEPNGNHDQVHVDAATAMWLRGERAAALALAYIIGQHSMRKVAQRIARDESADVVQDALLRVWNHPDRFDARRGTLEAYLITTTRGTALDHVRRTQRRRVREQRAAADRDSFTLEEETDLDLMHHLQVSLDALDHDARTLITNTYFEGSSYRRAAQALGLPEGTVKSRMRRTLERLRSDLRPADDDADQATTDNPQRRSRASGDATTR